MSLSKLIIHNLRNIDYTKLSLHPQRNLITGCNGSGKTSLLDAIYLLGTGRSYRSAHHAPLINRASKGCSVYGAACFAGRKVSLGIERRRDGGKEIRINGQTETLTSRLAKELPILYLGPDTIDILLGPPALRRRFLNWGVFHVEPSFTEDWITANRCLKQRNHLLRLGQGKTRQFSAWSAEFVKYSRAIDATRAQYFGDFVGCFQRLCDNLTDLKHISCEYYPGWKDAISLNAILEGAYETESRRAFTHAGYHRADIRVKVEGQWASQICSRGELKILAWAMVLTQGMLVQKHALRPITYLVDDLLSELDVQHRRGVCHLLEQTHAQIFATGIDTDRLLDCWHNENGRVFHVEHGNFSQEERDND